MFKVLMLVPALFCQPTQWSDDICYKRPIKLISKAFKAPSSKDYKSLPYTVTYSEPEGSQSSLNSKKRPAQPEIKLN